FFVIDDLEFQGEPPTLPTEPPVVNIASPPDGAELAVSTIDIWGTVGGEGLLPYVTLNILYRQPPEWTAGPFTSVLDLTGTGTSRQFAFPPPGFSGVPLGPVTVTVTAENVAGLRGSASSTFNNMPVAIRNRYQSEGGEARFGPFRFGATDTGCVAAV